MQCARMAGILAAACLLAAPESAAADQTITLAPPGGTLGAPVLTFTAKPIGAKPPLLVDWSVDGGASWTRLAAIESAPPRDWQIYEFAIPGAVGAASVQVRFGQTAGWRIDQAGLRDAGGGGVIAPFAPPVLTVSPIATANPAPGLTTITFTVSLDHPTTVDVSIDYEVRGADGTLVATGTLVVPAGQTSATGSATGPVGLEPFTVNLLNVKNATLSVLATSLSAPLSAEALLGALPGGPASPKRGKSFLLTTVSGNVRYHAPGQRYVALASGSVLLGFGSVVDTRRGRARVTVERDTAGGLQAAEFYSGAFGVSQSSTSPLTTMQLAGGAFSECTSASAGRARVSARRVVRRLWGSGTGAFRTKGRFGSATVRGTRWKTEDLCGATRFTVAEGAVTVRDFRRDRTVVVRAGHTYTVEALRSGSFEQRTGLNKPRLSKSP